MVRGVRARVLWQPRDLWLGVYVRPAVWEAHLKTQTVYICLLPMLPLQVSWVRKDLLRD